MRAVVIVFEGKDTFTKEMADNMAKTLKNQLDRLVMSNPHICLVIDRMLVGVDET